MVRYTCYRCSYGHKAPDGVPDLDACAMACAKMVRYVLEKEGDVAAVIAEPVRAVPYIPPPDFWQLVSEACDDHGALLIFDEIPGGLGKTGAMFASENFGVVPDIAVLGKALGRAAVPAPAVISKPELDVAGGVAFAFAFGHYTHEKNPLLCRAALTTIEIIEDEGLVENARVQGARAQGRLHDMAARHPLIGNVRGLGLLMGIDLVDDHETRTPALEAGDSILYRALGKGLSFKLTMGNVLTLTPPLTVTADEMNTALGIFDECLCEEEAARR